MPGSTQLPITETSYLSAESASASKHELIDGQVVAMAGAGVRHIDIVTHLSREILSHLKPPCRLMGNDTRFRAREHRDYYYPDLTIVCSERELLPGNTATLLNPTLIIEVLSKTTEFYDRGPKFEQYREMKSPKTYILVSQAKPLIEVYDRAGPFWTYRDYSQSGQSIALPAVGITITMDGVYQEIVFPEAG